MQTEKERRTAGWIKTKACMRKDGKGKTATFFSSGGHTLKGFISSAFFVLSPINLESNLKDFSCVCEVTKQLLNWLYPQYLLLSPFFHKTF
jgi:hypothetical protein